MTSVLTNLETIRTKVRRLTARPTVTQITNAQIDEYINTFYLYDFPEQLRLFSLKSTFEFMTTPNVDQYDLRQLLIETNTGNERVIDFFTNFKPPVYFAGYEGGWSQDRAEFERIYPKLSQINTTVVGNGTGGPYTFQLVNVPVLRNSVTLGVIDQNGDTQQVVDDGNGGWLTINTADVVLGSIDYLTGAGTITFAPNIPVGNQFTITAGPYQASRPSMLFFYDNVITLRPVPDKVYKVSMDAFKTPAQLLANSDNPELKQQWQYIAYGAAKKIFEDAQDMDSVQMITPELKNQERLILRRTLMQQAEQRTATIYSASSRAPYGWGSYGGLY